MSGYLRRLAAAAMHPPRAIHAVVGSVYAPHRPAAASALQEVSENPETSGDVVAPTGGRPGRAAHRHDGARQPTEFEADTFEAAFTPLVVEREYEPRSLSPRRAEPGEPAAGKTAAAGHDRRRGWLPRSEEHVLEISSLLHKDTETTASGPIEYHVVDAPAHATRPERETSGEARPLIEMQRISAESFSPRAVPSTIRPQSAGVLRPAGPLPRAERADEPDEIQIHIGRIEVTAAPPPVAARPAARPERRSVNLDDYLKQRRGGNR
ncbi:MAG TPA: hypothetical protein VIY53_09765 [Acidobacteriaceae bacterium]